MNTLSQIESPDILGDTETVSVGEKSETLPQKVLEEEEYLGRMAKIIRRDFFSDIEFQDDSESTLSSTRSTERSDRDYQATPGTFRSNVSESSAFSRQASCSLSLNEYLENYTSEDNAYFEKLQQKELKRHRIKYPWLYKDKGKHNKNIREQLKLPSIREQASLGCSDSPARMIDWPHNPKNSLFYPPSISDIDKKYQSTINYRSSYINRPIFKVPIRPEETPKQKNLSRLSDKIGIDGKLLNGSEATNVSGYSMLPTPETRVQANIPEPCSTKYDTNRFYIPMESPRDELAHRVYQEKVGNVIKTPKSFKTDTPSLRTPSTRKSYADFSFSPERVKISTPSLRKYR